MIGRKTGIVAFCLILAGISAAFGQSSPLGALRERLFAQTPTGIAHSNGRLEAQSVDVAGKYVGRITEVLVQEGEIVEAGAPVARLDDRDMQAQLLGAKAAVMRAKAGQSVADAGVAQAQSALSVAQTNADRVAQLFRDGHASAAVRDDAVNALNTARAALQSAEAQVEESAALTSAAGADLARLEIALDDLTIRAPLRGRVLYRLREPGEILAAGAAVATLLDLTDVYMNIYLPAAEAGSLTFNDEARLILDPIPQFVVPARVSFISPQAQFTPKAVETASEREDLVFRVKLSIPRELLVKFEDVVKTGVRGTGFVRVVPGGDWPADLTVKLPD